MPLIDGVGTRHSSDAVSVREPQLRRAVVEVGRLRSLDLGQRRSVAVSAWPA